MVAKRTPLYDRHLANGAKVIDFHGWEMPVQYQSIVQEHQLVRTEVGLFDVSHMGEFFVEGDQAEAFLQYLVTNDVSKLVDGKAQYTLMVDENGGTIDDLLIYRLAENRFMLVVNAGNIDSDFEWVQSHAHAFNVKLANRSDDIALIALQGPQAESILQTLTTCDLSLLRPFTFSVDAVTGVRTMISRTGYTGEDGFELYVEQDHAAKIFDALIDKGAKPAGLGARDTLRLEAKLALYGNELSRTVTPYEASLGAFVKLDKGPFIGRDVLEQQKLNGTERKLMGIEMLDRSIPRSGYDVFVSGERIGTVTSGTMSPTLQKPIGLILINVEFAGVGQEVEINIRGKMHPAVIIKTPFYKRGQA